MDSGGIDPRGLSAPEAFLHRFGRSPQHDRDVLVTVQAIADKEGHHDEIICLAQSVGIGDAGIFFHEDRMDIPVEPSFPYKQHLVLDRASRVLVIARAMPGDEQRTLGQAGNLRAGTHRLLGPSQDHLRHASVGTHGAAVMNLATIPLLDLRKERLTALSQTEFARDHLFGEVALADE